MSYKRKQFKKRSAYILFKRDTPFKPKVVPSHKVYSRKKKHKNAECY